ncbi:MAG TPA: hypothetical protein VGI89_04245 [Rhizomicrobium sp.]|jgi:tetratricopeptide (TPR) repeat protein
MKRILLGLSLAGLATPAFAIDAWPQCNSPLRDAKVLWACNQVIAHGWMSNTVAAATYENRAQTHLTLGHFDSAVTDATNALKMLPEPGKETGEDVKYVNLASEVRVRSFATRAAAHHKKSENDLADADAAQSLMLANRLIAANPNGQNYWLRAWVSHEMAKDTEALPDATKAVEAAEEPSSAIRLRATIEEALGRKDDAVADYRAALKLLMALKQPTQFQTTYIWFNVQALQRLGEKP